MRTRLTRLSIAAVLVASIGATSALTASASAAEGTTCSANSGSVTLSPGLTNESAKIQNIVVKGVLSGCTGSVTEAKYVAHLKTTNPVTCTSLLAPGETATGTVVVKWKPKGQGNSNGSLTLTGAAIGGTVESGPFAGMGISGSLESLTPVFTGKGEPCTKKNRLKKATFVGSPLTIA
jgi:hypothetical protein